MMFLARYWRILAVAAVIGLVLYAITGLIDRAEERGYDRATAEMAARVAVANQVTADLDAAARRASAIKSAEWEGERNELQSQVDDLLRLHRQPIRVCKPASAVPLPGAAAAPGSFDGGATGPVDAVRAGDDIAGAAVVYAGKCERYRRQLSALQEWLAVSR